MPKLSKFHSQPSILKTAGLIQSSQLPSIKYLFKDREHDCVKSQGRKVMELSPQCWTLLQSQCSCEKHRDDQSGYRQSSWFQAGGKSSPGHHGGSLFVVHQEHKKEMKTLLKDPSQEVELCLSLHRNFLCMLTMRLEPENARDTVLPAYTLGGCEAQCTRSINEALLWVQSPVVSKNIIFPLPVLLYLLLLLPSSQSLSLPGVPSLSLSSFTR